MKLSACGGGAVALEDIFRRFARMGLESGTDGAGMLRLIAALRACADPRTAWGVTSHAQLYLVPRCAPMPPLYVKLFARGHEVYDVEYLMPAAGAPWPGASVVGQAHGLDRAVAMTLTAMDASGGWATTKVRTSGGSGRRRRGEGRR
jgi:hypothetical protein